MKQKIELEGQSDKIRPFYAAMDAYSLKDSYLSVFMLSVSTGEMYWVTLRSAAYFDNEPDNGQGKYRSAF